MLHGSLQKAKVRMEPYPTSTDDMTEAHSKTFEEKVQFFERQTQQDRSVLTETGNEIPTRGLQHCNHSNNDQHARQDKGHSYEFVIANFFMSLMVKCDAMVS